MLDIDDHLLMRCTSAPSNDSLDFRRRLGGYDERLVVFLPWRITLAFAERAGIVPKRFFALYELPNALVSPDPQLCATAMRRLVDDAAELIGKSGGRAAHFAFVGLSLGSAPATYLANRFGCRLISVASADRGDLMLWESPAVAPVKARALERGYRLADFTAALQGMHCADNLHNIGPLSTFVVAGRDLYVPRQRRRALIDAVRRDVPEARIVFEPAGHARTISWAMRRIGSDGSLAAPRIGIPAAAAR